MKRIPPVFIRYLLLFLCFASVLLLLFVPIYRYITGFTLENELAYMTDKLNAGIKVIDAALADLNNTAVSTRQDSRFKILNRVPVEPAAGTARKPDRVFPDLVSAEISPYALIELRNVFNTLLGSRSLLGELGIVFPDNSCLTSRRICYYPALNPFYGDFFRCEGLSKNEWLALLKEDRPFIPVKTYYTIDYGEYEAITYAARWAWADYPDEIILFATLPVENIVSLIADKDVGALGYITIYDSRGRLLFPRKTGPAAGFHVITAVSAGNSIKYEIGIPDFLIQEKMRPLRNLIFLFAVITAVVTIFLSLLFAWQSTKPLQDFIDGIVATKLISGEYEQVREKLSLNPFKSFRQIFYHMAGLISEADKKMENSLRIIERETQLLRIRMLDKIREALESGNDAAACIILQESAGALPEPEDPPISSLLADMFTGMIRNLKEEYPELLRDINVPSYTYGNQNAFFRQNLPGCFMDIGDCVRKYREKGITKSDREILDFINEHICDPELYVTMVADHFHISAPSVQKIVKKVSGETFLAYVENHRLSKAYEILVRGDHSIAETAALCGFSYANSFTRTFKRVYGFSPSRILNTSGSVVKDNPFPQCGTGI